MDTAGATEGGGTAIVDGDGDAGIVVAGFVVVVTSGIGVPGVVVVVVVVVAIVVVVTPSGVIVTDADASLFEPTVGSPVS